MNRKPVVAGRFYPAQKEKLIKEIENYFFNAKQASAKNVKAIIAPHAGYVFSGQVAASGFNQIDKKKHYDNVFVLASSHQIRFTGASVYNIGNYETPLGTININNEICDKLINENNIFSFRFEAHSQEHSLEVQLPFLQYAIKNDFRLIPIILGSDSAHDCKQIANILKPYFTDNNLFVISSDFSHYPDYENAISNDNRTADAIVSNNAEKLLDILKANKKARIKDLSTSLCGWTSVLTLMYMTEEMKNISYKKIQYQNSGDSIYGDKNGVVGYYSFAISENEEAKSAFILSKKDKKDLINIARSTLDTYIAKGKKSKLDTIEFSENLNTPCGAFVTLYKKGKLRGCIGRFGSGSRLWEVVQDMAISSATQDNRFNIVKEDELDEIDIEISVLTPLEKINSLDELEIGKHGIYIKDGYSSGTFLPQVATEQGWNKEEFVGRCSRDKVGIGYTGWKNAELYRYESIIIEEKIGK